MITKRAVLCTCVYLGVLALCGKPANAQIAKVVDDSGRLFFINAEPPVQSKLAPARSHAAIYMPAETTFTGRGRPAFSIDRDGAEKLVREAAERHNVDPALVRAVIETESNWNSSAISRRGAVGLMQLMPTTAQRFGATEFYSPQQNVDAGVKYLKTLLERYNGNLDLALAAYNAGEGAVEGLMEFRRFERHVTTCRKYRVPTSGQARADCRICGSILGPSTRTWILPAASYSPTNEVSAALIWSELRQVGA